MSLGRRKEQQRSMWLSYDQFPQSKGHVFYERLQKILRQGGFDSHVENLCAPFYAEKLGRKSIPPGRYFRMLLIGYFEGIDSERGICWRCSDSLSLREFLGLAPAEAVPDHSSLCRIRQRLPLEVHHEMFVLVLKILHQARLFEGKYLGIDASTMEANAAMKSIVRRDTGESYEEMLVHLAQASGIPTPTKAELINFDRKRQGKKTSNKDWQSATDEEARIAKLKDGRTHMAYKPEHAVDLESGAIVSAVIRPAGQGDLSSCRCSPSHARRQPVGLTQILVGRLVKVLQKTDESMRPLAADGSEIRFRFLYAFAFGQMQAVGFVNQDIQRKTDRQV